MFDSIAQNTQVPETINDSRMETDAFHWSRMNVIWIIHKHSFVDIMLVNVYKKIQKTSTTRVNEYKFTQRYEDWHMPSTFIRVCVCVCVFWCMCVKSAYHHYSCHQKIYCERTGFSLLRIHYIGMTWCERAWTVVQW